MATLDVFRSTVAAAALGFSRRAFDEAASRTAARKLFGAPMSDLQLVQASLADMALKIDASALLIYRAAWLKDQGAPRVTREAAMAKLYATDEAQAVIDHGRPAVRRPRRRLRAIRSSGCIGRSAPCASTKAPRRCRRSSSPGRFWPVWAEGS